ncbi:hypothetical protein [Sphaerisporangium perillae]|uniref:hypothetical protein n=1 Tax=Sphaerisporangium perillae TaxID=2935860 RepID=UPI00200D9A03|nr:hypothetical protein [Sphaerisporangium perillae]
MSEASRYDDGRTGPVADPAERRPYQARRVHKRKPRRRDTGEVQDLRTPSGRTTLPY